MKRIIYIFFLLIVAKAQAQQRIQSSLLHVNEFSLNKSFAGNDSCVKVFGQQKNQWLGVNGAPINSALQIQLPISQKLGFGVNFNHWKAGILRSTDLDFTFAYHLMLNQKTKLSPSLSLGYNVFGFNSSNLFVFDQGDLVNQNRQNQHGVFADFGLLLQSNNFEVGLAIPRFFSSDPSFEIAKESQVLNIESYLNLHAAYNYDINSKMAIKPYLIYRSIPSFGEILDAMLSFEYNKTIGFSAGYRSRNGLIASVNYSFNKFTVAYAYDAGMSNLNGISAGSHEFLLAYKFCKTKKIKKVEPEKEPMKSVIKFSYESEFRDANTNELINNATVKLSNKQSGEVINKTINNGTIIFELIEGIPYQIEALNPNYELLTHSINASEKKEVFKLTPKILSLFGTIKDKQTGEVIEGVKVKIGDNQLSTDKNGFFDLKLSGKQIGQEILEMVTFERKGYVTASANLKTMVKGFDPINVMQFLDKEIEMQPLAAGADLAKLIDLKPIYFEVNSSEISDASKIELDKIVQILNNNEDMKLQVESHTDCRGNANANLKLSDARAKSSADYIKSKISNPERVSGKGFGANRPLETCKDCKSCNDEAHNKNRRTEFRVVY